MSSRSPNSSLCSSKDDGSNYYFETSDDGSFALLGERIISFNEFTPLAPNGSVSRLPPYVSHLRQAKADNDDSIFNTGNEPHSYQHDYLISYDQGCHQAKRNVGKGLGLLGRFEAISSSPNHCGMQYLQSTEESKSASSSSRMKCICWSILTFFAVAGIVHFTTRPSFLSLLMHRHDESYWDDTHVSRWRSNNDHRTDDKYKNETRFSDNKKER